MTISTNLSLITLNINGLNSPVKRHRVVEWIKKKDPAICCLQGIYFKPKDTNRLKVKGQKKVFHKNGNEKKAALLILMSQKIDLETKTARKDIEQQHNDKGVSPTRGYKIWKHLYIQHGNN